MESVATASFGDIPVSRRLCPLCGRDNEAEKASRYSLPPWSIKDCPACRFVYIDRAPLAAQQVTAMAWDRATKVEEQRRDRLRPLSYRASKRLRFRLHLLPRRSMLAYVRARIDGGAVLDLGCGDGQALRDFPASFRPFGIELAALAAAAADRQFRERGGGAVQAACLEGLRAFESGTFDAACLRSYLEHEAEPLAVLREVARVLTPAGFAVVKVPNYGSLNRRVMGRHWCGFRYPEHLNYFTPATLTVLAARAGFRARFGLGGRLPTGDNMWAVLERSSPLALNAAA